MKTKNKLYSFFLTAIIMTCFSILVSSTASASVTETRITTTGSVTGCDFDGNKIAWNNLFGDLYTYDLSTSKTMKVPVGKAYNPSIYGNKIAWESWGTGFNNVNIHLYDLSTKKDTTITTGGVAYNPIVDGNYISWEDDRNGGAVDGGYMTGNYDIYLYNIASKKETKITKTQTASHHTIYGNKIAWQDNKSGKIDIHVYDISTKKETQITTSGKANYPAIFGNRLVWLDYRHDTFGSGWYYPDVYMYDLTTHVETRITTTKSFKADPVIYGNSIAWYDERNIGKGGRIYLYDLSTHQQIQAPEGNGFPDIYSNKIIWVDNRNDNDGDVYMGTISFLPVANFTASPTSGTHPLNVKFTEKSTDSYYWSWDFGDKTTSTQQSPVHKYSKAGKYSVTLTVKNAAGKNTMKKTNYITVK